MAWNRVYITSMAVRWTMMLASKCSTLMKLVQWVTIRREREGR